MLQNVPAATPSSAARLLMRKLLLTVAPPPPGGAALSFNALRLTRLLDGGFVDDAADLAMTMQAPANMEILRAQADALVYASRDSDTCGDYTAKRLESAEASWVELRAYCYAVAGNSAPLELTRSVISDQGITDPAFLTLLDGMVSGKPMAPDVIRLPDPLHVVMFARLNLPMPVEFATGLGMPASRIVAASMQTPKAIRLAAAEKALRAGVLPTPLLVEILDLSSFTPQELVGALALARSEPMMNGLARLRAALKVTQQPVARADFIHVAFEIGEREGLLAQVAQLFADDAAAIVPARDWDNWSDLMIRGLLLAGRPEAAARWYEILDPGAPDATDIVNQLELTLAFAAPDYARTMDIQAILSMLAGRGSLSQAVAARATLILGLFDALSLPMPADAQAAVEPLVSMPSPGRRPPPALMQRIDRAALAGSRGDVALSVVSAMGPQGARDLAPDIIVHLVRALQTAGIRDAAHALAQEALLLRPAGG